MSKSREEKNTMFLNKIIVYFGNSLEYLTLLESWVGMDGQTIIVF